MNRALTHDGALDIIIRAASVTTLSYQEAIESYLMCRRLEQLFASADTRPKGGDALGAPFTSGPGAP